MESRTYPEIRQEIIDRIAATPMSPSEIRQCLKEDPATVVDEVIYYLVQKGIIVWDSSGYKLTTAPQEAGE